MFRDCGDIEHRHKVFVTGSKIPRNFRISLCGVVSSWDS